jgi:predicted unusual protein kinase regulating ubiquinone biosynthesis (AarF/ABC1/UbiB family)
MMLVDNLIHSDLHPGNILVRLEPPRGLLGWAYKTVNKLASTEGPALRAISRLLNTLQLDQQQQQQQQQSGADLTSTAVLTSYDSSQQEQQQERGGPSSLRRWFLDACAAAGGPAGLVQKLQQHLAGVAAGWLQPHIVLLDVGMATELSPEDQHNMVGLFR